jgi:hypothetical protein
MLHRQASAKPLAANTDRYIGTHHRMGKGSFDLSVKCVLDRRRGYEARWLFSALAGSKESREEQLDHDPSQRVLSTLASLTESQSTDEKQQQINFWPYKFIFQTFSLVARVI